MFEKLLDFACEQIESVEDDDSNEFDIDMVLEQFEDHGKFKGILICNGNDWENHIPVSVAKQIVRAKGLGGALGYLREEDK